MVVLVMVDGQTGGYELPKVEGEKAVRVSLLAQLLEKSKLVVERVKTNPEIRESMTKEKERALRDLVLTGLVLCELVPVAEWANDLGKWSGVAKKLAEKAPEIKKAGKITGVIGDLYPEVPKWFLATMAGLDGLGAPYVGIAPEIIQLMVDRKQSLANQTRIAGETFKTIKDVFFKKSEYAKAQTEQALEVFKG